MCAPPYGPEPIRNTSRAEAEHTPSSIQCLIAYRENSASIFGERATPVREFQASSNSFVKSTPKLILESPNLAEDRRCGQMQTLGGPRKTREFREREYPGQFVEFHICRRGSTSLGRVHPTGPTFLRRSKVVVFYLGKVEMSRNVLLTGLSLAGGQRTATDDPGRETGWWP
jgi:hypothetical protein